MKTLLWLRSTSALTASPSLAWPPNSAWPHRPSTGSLTIGRDALVHACLAYAGRSMTPPPDGLSWQDILRHAAEEVWACCEKYPGLDITIFQFPSAFTHIEDYLRNIVSQLVKTGLGQEQAAFAFDFIGDTTIACHIGVAALRQVGDDGRTGIEVVRDRTSDTSIYVPEPGWTDRGTLDRKVEFIIRGMEKEVEG